MSKNIEFFSPWKVLTKHFFGEDLHPFVIIWFLNEDKPETCWCGPVEEDGVGYDDQQHGRVRGDIVRDGVLEALFATATTAPDFSGEDHANPPPPVALWQLEEPYLEMDG